MAGRLKFGVALFFQEMAKYLTPAVMLNSCSILAFGILGCEPRRVGQGVTG